MFDVDFAVCEKVDSAEAKFADVKMSNGKLVSVKVKVLDMEKGNVGKDSYVFQRMIIGDGSGKATLSFGT